ncbi:MAG TPA: hypothetical protein VEZ11_13280 [Thermoanaerobaculia bacterium]|nr:hypothetical protein [Thermoanaerobaculia bacterium]
MLRRAVPLAVIATALAGRAVLAAGPASPVAWQFAVAGDSRNCGDVVMPAIAAGAKQARAAFYWHLGDFRAFYKIDEDMAAAARVAGKELEVAGYLGGAWPDFIRNQIAPFDPIPFYLAIGNHELIGKSRADYLAQFADWLEQEPIRRQRLADDSSDHQLRTYNHWIVGGTDFIALDSASGDMFDDPQVSWLEKVIAADRANPAVKSVVAGMHAALPHSLACGHSMSDKPQSDASGTRVYKDLLAFHKETGKPVYVLASHSHFYIANVFDSDYWNANGGVLPGWIIGTAGANRYPLPEVPLKGEAIEYVYGYLLASVHEDGTIDFRFRKIEKSDIPASVVERYSQPLVDQCFDGNRDLSKPKAVTCMNVEGCK